MIFLAFFSKIIILFAPELKNLSRMKKIILYGTVFVIGMIASSNTNVAKKEFGDMVLRNIEVLSSGETGNDIGCFLIGSLDCPKNESKVAYIW